MPWVWRLVWNKSYAEKIKACSAFQNACAPTEFLAGFAGCTQDRTSAIGTFTQRTQHDQQANDRDYDDTRFCIDHFQTKLLHLADGFQTATGQRLAQVRHERLKGFVEQFKEEIGIG
ncbi:hypothetical protein EMIT0P258_20592 [Pseudomonas sp. IT-P258]